MAQEIFCAALGEPLVEGVWVYPARWGFPDGEPIQRSFLWRVELRRRQRVLVAQDTGQVLRLTAELAAYLGVIHPSHAVSITDYPSQWKAWRDDGWGIYIMDACDDGIMLSARSRRGTYTCRIEGNDFLELLRTPGGMEKFLIENLHSANRPIPRKKAKPLQPRSSSAQREETCFSSLSFYICHNNTRHASR
ncbi:hypothetical protein [Hymenobacter profundi]|uniref:NECAP PHear domain-containing protein n=1 Tax=Hymenobacter profundi TaxID=1982110 RepID=A0ABS6WZ48_9BACT|nr:hypothetical protein [Hymenobacter profundi]MBW3128874.1 hypothetical protein [Hymenobacter profundi]